jgi:hypothetical protein
VNSYVSTGVESGESVLRHEDTDHGDIGLARPLTPADAVYAGSIDKLREHERRALMMRCLNYRLAFALIGKPRGC